MEDITHEIEYTTETVEVEEISEDGVPTKKFKKVIKAFDPKYDWKSDPNYKNWLEKKNDDNTTTVTYYETAEATECIEIGQGEDRSTIEVVKTVPKTNIIVNTTPSAAITGSSRSTTVVHPVRNNRSTKRQIKVVDPNQPAFVCTEHNENISLDCRYCRIASGFKKKSTQRIVQNSEITSSGKVTVTVPKRDGNKSVRVQKHFQKFRPEWLILPEFKDWLMEDTETQQAKCRHCCTLLVNNANNLVRHAISQKHMKSMDLELLDLDDTMEDQIPPRSPQDGKSENGKEEIFGQYVASELKRIRSKKTYEEVKWKILQALQTAAEREADDPENLPL